MEDSLELPDEELQEINFVISPNMSHKKYQRKQPESVESLAYSNGTSINLTIETYHKYLLT